MSTAADGRLQVSIGNGDGTFKPPVESAATGSVLNTGDFNGDHLPDVIAIRGTPSGFQFFILPGTGTAALGQAIPVAVASSIAEGVFAVSADFDGDGHRDFVLPNVDGASSLLAGHGDFTFAAPLVITRGVGIGAVEGITADDVTVADVNRDQLLDLVIAGGRRIVSGPPQPGTVTVSLGDGRGGFVPGADYESSAGADADRGRRLQPRRHRGHRDGQPVDHRQGRLLHRLQDLRQPVDSCRPRGRFFWRRTQLRRRRSERRHHQPAVRALHEQSGVAEYLGPQRRPRHRPSTSGGPPTRSFTWPCRGRRRK